VTTTGTTMKRLLASVLLLAALCAPTFGAASTMDISASDSASVLNKVQAAITINSTENSVTVVVGPRPRTVVLVSDTAWIYRSAPSGTDFKVSAAQTLTLEFGATTTFYHVRQTADGTLSALVVK
jgi:hypothetical protein